MMTGAITRKTLPAIGTDTIFQARDELPRPFPELPPAELPDVDSRNTETGMNCCPGDAGQLLPAECPSETPKVQASPLAGRSRASQPRPEPCQHRAPDPEAVILS